MKDFSWIKRICRETDGIPSDRRTDCSIQKAIKEDKTRLSYWFPTLLAAGLPVPRTVLVEATEEEVINAKHLLFEDVESKEMHDLVARIKQVTDEIGYPCFLRTDYTSAKHYWDKSCYVTSPDKLFDHVMEIAAFSEASGLIGMPIDVWAVREYLPVKPMGFCRNYENMPVVKEFRVFVDGNKLECIHPYWPKDALERGQVEWLPENSFCPEVSLSYLDISNRHRIDYLAEKVGGILGGRWSVDILDVGGSHVLDEYRWYVTDLAEAHKSWHWPDCHKNQERK